MTITGLPEFHGHHDSFIESFKDHQGIISVYSEIEDSLIPKRVLIKLTKEQALQLAEELTKLATEK